MSSCSDPGHVTLQLCNSFNPFLLLWCSIVQGSEFNLKDAPPVMCFVEFLGKSCFLLRATYKIVPFCVSLNGKSQFLYLLRRFEKSFPVMVITRQQQDVVPSATG